MQRFNYKKTKTNIIKTLQSFCYKPKYRAIFYCIFKQIKTLHLFATFLCFKKTINEKLKRGGDMPRVSRKKKIEAERLFYKGMKLADIAKSLEVSEGTVRSWKNRGNWEEKILKKTPCNITTKEIEKDTALQKKKQGGQIGNKNAEKHGAYSKTYWDTLDEEELDLIHSMTDVEEEQLIMQLQMFSIRERRFMKNIKKYQEIEQENHGLAVEEVSKTKNIEDLINMDGESIASGKYKKVKGSTVTKTKAVINSIIALETELTKIQRAKTKAIDALAKIRLEKQKLENENAGNDDVYDWMEAVLREEEASDE